MDKLLLNYVLMKIKTKNYLYKTGQVIPSAVSTCSHQFDMVAIQAEYTRAPTCVDIRVPGA